VDVEGNTITFSFKGKSGVYHELEITHPRVAKTVRSCLDLPGYELFQYVDENNNRQTVDSSDVNTYLQTYAGADFSAKDFRTWGGSVLAGDDLYQKGVPETTKDKKDNILQAVKDVAKQLGNTRTVCRTYYIHPTIITSYEKDILVPHFERSYKQSDTKKFGLSVEERAMLSLIKSQ
jgi:DNA topoisomerase-1